MSLRDLDHIQLPNLSDTTLYPTVTHGPSCTDAQPVDTRSCHATPLVRPRPYAYPTEPLGRLKIARQHHPALPFVPPSLGTMCPTIETDFQAQVGDAAAISQDNELRGGDACRPTIRPIITFPCTRINPSVALTTGLPAAASFAPPVNHRDANQCIQDLLLNIKVPGCTLFTTGTNQVQMVDSPASAGVTRTIANTTDGNCGIKVTDVIKVPCVMPNVTSGGVTVNGVPNGSTLSVSQTGPACSRNIAISLALVVSGGGGSAAFSPPFKVGGSGTDPSLSGACVSSYGHGRIVPVIDVDGVITGTPNTLIDNTVYNIINDDRDGLCTGDFVNLSQDPTTPTNLFATLA